MSPSFRGPGRQQSDVINGDIGSKGGVASANSEAVRDYANSSAGFKKR